MPVLFSLPQRARWTTQLDWFQEHWRLVQSSLAVTLMLAAVVLGERITFRVAGGVALMIIGALLTLR
jgi:hypothetical protein